MIPSTESDDDLDLLARSEYFDCGWYLSAYKDVDRAGLNPIRHYLDCGAAEGRNPSRMFDTKWYQAHNPEVSASGLNPLVHYLRLGVSKGKHPSPVAAFLKSKVEASSAETEKLLEIYSASQRPRPEPTTADNYFDNRWRWAEYFVSQGVSALRKSDFLTALDQLKRGVQVYPESRDHWVLYSHAFRLYNSEALQIFESNVRKAELLVTHVCCEKLLDAGRLSMESFHDSTRRVENIIVVGGKDQRSFNFDPRTRVLRVPSGDSYECLPVKMSHLFLFLGFSSTSQSILKVDDDIHCTDISKLHDDLTNLIAISDYGGQVRPPLASPFHDPHIWHLGKCEDPTVNSRPDGFFTWRAYVDGAYYWLSSNSVNLLAKGALMHDRYFECDRFEDRAVGNVLGYYEVRPMNAILTSGSLREIKCKS